MKIEDEKAAQERVGDDPVEGMIELEAAMLADIVLKGVPNIKKVYMRKEKRYLYDTAGAKKEEEEWILDTEGTNLMRVLSVEGVDHRRTISNDVVEILRVLGIEACRIALLKELRRCIEFDGSYINYRHLALLSEIMTCRGYLMSITRHGINRVDTGALMRSSYEESVEILFEAAMFAETDHCKGVSQNIMLGNMCPLGTGHFALLMDEEALKSGTSSFIYVLCCCTEC